MMTLHLYQSYYQKDQENTLNSIFIPYDNTKNETPELREYPMWKALYEKHKGTMVYWGLLSWRWLDKTKLPAEEFKQWILDNPGYDVYHIDPFLDVSVSYPNIWIQGDRWHPGMINFCNRLFPKIGINKPVESIIYKPKDFATCNYFVGNTLFWGSYLKFLDEVIEICQNDPELNHYMFEDKRLYNGAMIPSFSFIVERLFSLHNFTKPKIKVKKFPVSWHNYEKMYGPAHSELVRIYDEKNNQ